MKKLQPNEAELTGNWIVENGKVRGDEAAERLDWLVTNHLKKIAISKEYGAWETLFQDPDDKRYWEQTYPHGEMHGGGPKKLTMLSPEQAKTKYQLSQ